MGQRTILNAYYKNLEVQHLSNIFTIWNALIVVIIGHDSDRVKNTKVAEHYNIYARQF